MHFRRFKLLGYPFLALVMITGLLVMHHSIQVHTYFPAATRTQTVTISSAGFLPNRITVREGDLVSLMIVNTDLKPHNLAIHELKIASSELKPSQSALLQFSARKKGSYAFVSDTPGYPETGFQGMLIIQ